MLRRVIGMNTKAYVLFLLISAMLVSCGSDRGSSADTGAISFSLVWDESSRSISPSASIFKAPAPDVCVEYGLATVSAKAYNSSNAVIASASWPCSAHAGSVPGVPTGANIWFQLDGIDAADAVLWRGEKTGITLNSGQTVNTGPITMVYIGNDTANPTISSQTPTANATGVPVNAALTVTFSESMAPSTINDMTFLLSAGVFPVHGAVTYNAGTKTASFTPPPNLFAFNEFNWDTTYTATITSGAKDMAGNAIASNVTWTFTTATPSLVSISISPEKTAMVKETTMAFRAKGTYSDTRIRAIAAPVTWSSSNITVATIDSTGTATAMATGSTTLTAVYAGMTATTSLTVLIPVINVPETGQTASSSAGDDGELRFGVAWPVSRFTNTDGTTPISGSVVVDQLTGLMWTRDGNAPGPVACSPAVYKTWQAALDYVACLNANSYLGFNDWRLPNRRELRSLLEYGRFNIGAWLNSQGFTNAQDDGYWSSTTNAFDVTYAWGVNLSSGFQGAGPQFNVNYVWPVRTDMNVPSPVAALPKTGRTSSYAAGDDGDLGKGIAWPNPRFTNADGTTSSLGTTVVLDQLTGLMWANEIDYDLCNKSEPMQWQVALDFVACLNDNYYLGYNDWRLPNVNELESLVDAERDYLAVWLNNQGFVRMHVVANFYWSSTSYAGGASQAWLVSMGDGYIDYGAKNLYFYFWPVRGGR